MLFQKPTDSKPPRPRRRQLALKQSVVLNFERLEARHLMASLVVGNTSDVTNGNTDSIPALIANNGGDGISLREATIASNNTDGADSITFAPAVFIGGTASLIRLTQGDLQVTDTLTIDGTSATGIVITGDANNNDVTLSGTDITDVGASLSANTSSLDDNSRVINFSDSDGTLTLSNLTLTGGRTIAENANGGGVYATLGDVLLINSIVSGNSVAGDLSDGGGVHTYSGNVSLTNSTINGNRASGYSGYGGGIYTSSGDLLLTNSTISDNNTLGANSDGGGIFTNTGDVTLIGSTVSGNQTTGSYSEGGGILTYAGNVSLTNSTLSANRTVGYMSYGAGIYTSSGDVALTNSTVVENSTSGVSSNGGGIFAFDGSVTIRNSIVAGNIVSNGTAPDLRPGNTGPLSVSNSLIGNTVGSGVTVSTGTGNLLNQNAMLGPLTDNGGPTLTHAPLQGSPIIDAGNNSLAVSETGDSLTTDQRGGAFDRVESGTVDIGAVEAQNPATALSIVSATINEGGVLARPDLWNTLTVVFDSDANVTIGDLLLFNDSQGGIGVNLTGIRFNYDSFTNTAVWDFTEFAPLPAAFYSYRLDGGISSSTGLLLDGNGDESVGDDFVAEHYVAIPGDANLDGRVDVVEDAFSLVANLNQTSNLAYADGNFNGDGSVNVVGDAFILVANLGLDVRPALSATTLVTAQSQSTQARVVAPQLFATSDNVENRVKTTPTDNVIASRAEATPLVLSGAHGPRDDFFGNDF